MFCEEFSVKDFQSMQFKRKKRRKLKSNQTKGKSKSKSTVIAKVKVVKKTNKKPNQKHPDKGKI